MKYSVISTAIIVQLREIDFACDPAFGIMSRMLWSNLKQVSGQSAYAGELANAVEQVIELIKPLVEQKKYLRNLFDKTCRLVALERKKKGFQYHQSTVLFLRSSQMLL